MQARVSFHVRRSYIAHSSLTKSLVLKRGPCLQHDHVDPPPGQLVGDGPAARARADDDDDAVVVQVVGDGGDVVVIEVRRDHRSASASVLSSEIQSISSKPRSM